MTFALAIFAFLTISLVYLLIYQRFFTEKAALKKRMDYVKSMGASFEEADDFKKPFAERVITPVYNRFMDFLTKMTPDSIKKSYTTMIYQSGNAKKISYSNLIAIQIAFGSVMVVLMILLLGANVMKMFPLLILMGAIGFFLPYSLIRTNGKKRQAEIRRQLPDLLDMLYVSVEAGLGFDMALRKTVDKIKGPISVEMRWALDDIQKGKERQEAFKAMVERTGVDDVGSFITSINQAEQLGSNIANMLRIQSNMMRTKRKQRAEEAAAKLPVKLLLPLVFFLVPAIFIVILGPAVLNTIESLKSM